MTFFNPYKVDIIWKLKTQISRLKSAFQMKLTVISSVLPASTKQKNDPERHQKIAFKIRHSKLKRVSKSHQNVIAIEQITKEN